MSLEQPGCWTPDLVPALSSQKSLRSWISGELKFKCAAPAIKRAGRKESFWNVTQKRIMQEARYDETRSAVEGPSSESVYTFLHDLEWRPFFESAHRALHFFLRPWCLNSHSALHIASFSKRKKLKYYFSLAIGLSLGGLILILLVCKEGGG